MREGKILESRCFGHQLLLRRQRHSPSSHTDRRAESKSANRTFFDAIKADARLEDLSEHQLPSGRTSLLTWRPHFSSKFRITRL
jgi:hypothetical protein